MITMQLMPLKGQLTKGKFKNDSKMNWTHKNANDAPNDANQGSNPSAGITSKEASARFVKALYLVSNSHKHILYVIYLNKLLNLNFSYAQSNEPSYDAREGRYEGYRDPNLPEGYAAYGENGNAEAVYDRYDPEYDYEEIEGGRRLKQSCCKRLRSGCSDMGWFIHNLNKDMT